MKCPRARTPHTPYCISYRMDSAFSAPSPTPGHWTSAYTPLLPPDRPWAESGEGRGSPYDREAEREVRLREPRGSDPSIKRNPPGDRRRSRPWTSEYSGGLINTAGGPDAWAPSTPAPTRACAPIDMPLQHQSSDASATDVRCQSPVYLCAAVIFEHASGVSASVSVSASVAGLRCAGCWIGSTDNQCSSATYHGMHLAWPYAYAAHWCT